MAKALAFTKIMFFYFLPLFDRPKINIVFNSDASCYSLLRLYLGNSQVSVYRTIGPTLVFKFNLFDSMLLNVTK